MLHPPPTGLFAEVSAAGDARPGGPPAECGPWSVSETPSLQVAVRTFADVQTLRDEARGVEVVVHGQLLDGMTLSRLVDSYLDQGPSFLKDCNGSFSLLLVDRRRDAVLAATDRLGSRPLHLREADGRTYVSTRLGHLTTPTSSPDLAGVAWYLSCGIVHTERTVLREVSRVPCATCLALTDRGREAVRYWRFELTREHAGTPEDRLRDDLADLLVSSVKKRLSEREDPLLSLSAGHDARGILAVLTHVLRVEGLQTFSYGVAEGVPRSDATVAAHLAEMRGVPHRFLPSYDGAFDEVIERNVLWGDGSANFCDEALVWERLTRQYQARRPPLFLGDTVFNHGQSEAVTAQDVLGDARMLGFSGLSWLARLLPRGQYRRLGDALAPDLERLERSIAHMDDVLDMGDFLYVDEYLPRRLLPWRECYAARGFTIQEPLLDNDLLDFARGLPPELRREKQLYRAAATSLDPDLFAEPRAAVSGCDVDWRSELRRRAAALTASCERAETSGTSLLDDVVDPSVVGATLGLRTLADEEKPSQAAARRALQRQWRRVRRRIGGREPPSPVSPVEFLHRYLVLRRFLDFGGRESLLTRLQAADGVARRPLLP